MDPAEIADEVNALKKEGKILSIGVSNFSTSQFDLLQKLVSSKTNVWTKYIKEILCCPR